MKVSELSGGLLDYWVFAAETGRPFDSDMYVNPAYSPSTNWAQGGAIIERRLIALEPSSKQIVGDNDAVWWAGSPDVFSEVDEGDYGCYGATPLIAAMRAYVASKFGNEVPDEGMQND
jgi:Protein of unknown function (DUF2591)